jgi:hypothetical protein
MSFPSQLNIPRRLGGRPRDKRGLPIPWGVVILPDGTPDFRVSDGERWLRCIRERLCPLCGLPIKRSLWFVGGPSCMEHRLFQDPGMHRDCAEFALRVCPFMAQPKAHFSDLERRPPPPGYASVETPGISVEKPDRFVLAATTKCEIVRLNGMPFIQASAWSHVFWWKDGAPLPIETTGEKP